MLSEKDLRDSIDDNEELEDDFKESLLALIDCALDMPTYFAKRIHYYINYIYGKHLNINWLWHSSRVNILVNKLEFILLE